MLCIIYHGLLIVIGWSVWCKAVSTLLLLWRHDLPGVEELQAGIVFLWKCAYIAFYCI